MRTALSNGKQPRGFIPDTNCLFEKHALTQYLDKYLTQDGLDLIASGTSLTKLCYYERENLLMICELFLTTNSLRMYFVYCAP